MIKDKWMTDFYGLDWYRIQDLSEIDLIEGPCLIEYLIGANEYQKIDDAQHKGFVIVETAIEFETLIDSSDEPQSNIRLAAEEDFEAILNITRECYVEHEKFYNRLRNLNFFTKEQAWEYYKCSVTNNFHNDSSLTVVVDDDEGICAYYILKHVGDLELFAKYKGIIAGVSKKARGRNLHVEMQKKLTEIIGKPYITNNRTQLGNYRVIGNHLKEHRQLLQIEHICYLKKF